MKKVQNHLVKLKTAKGINLIDVC